MDEIEFTDYDPTALVPNGTPLPPEPPPLDPNRATYAAVVDLLRELNRTRRVLLVHPDNLQRVRAAVAQLPINLAPGLIEVSPSSFVKPNELFLMPRVPAPADVTVFEREQK